MAKLEYERSFVWRLSTCINLIVDQDNFVRESDCNSKCWKCVEQGLDRYPEEETGTFVARVVPGGSSARAGLRENDKILRINNKVNMEF